MTPDQEQALDGLLREYARAGDGVDEAFVARVVAALPGPQRRWPWPLAAAALLAVGVAGAVASGPNPSLPAPPAPTPSAAAAAAPREPQLVARGDNDPDYGHVAWLPVAAARQPWPLLLMLNGVGERGDGSIGSLPALTRHGPGRLIAEGKPWFDEVLVVAPQSPGDWNARALDRFLALLEHRYPVDRQRIWLTGSGDGGGELWRFALRHADRIAAVVPIGGAAGLPEPGSAFTRPLPIWAEHGLHDRVIPPACTLAWMGLRAGLPPAQGLAGTWVPGAHGWELRTAISSSEPCVLRLTDEPDHGWTRAYADRALWDWLFAQRLPASH